MYNRKAFKLEAKELMRTGRPHYMLVALVYVLLTTGLNYAVTAVTGANDILAGTLSVFLNILVWLFSMVMGVGLAHYTLRLSRREQPAMGDLFESFAFAGRSIGMNILISVYSFLWALLIVGVYALVVAGAVLLMEDAVVVSVILIALGYIGLMIAMIAVVLRYAMSGFALAEDPDAGASAAIRRSVQMMRGNRWKLFVMELSFLGWNILVGLIAGAVTVIGFLASGTSWMVEGILMSGVDVEAITELVGGLSGQLSLWTMLGEIVGLPLTLWLTMYMQTSFARFYNFASGYDAGRNGACEPPQYAASIPLNQAAPQTSEPPAPPREPERPADEPQPEAPRPEEPPRPAAPATPPGGYYTPAPRLDDDEDEGEEI